MDMENPQEEMTLSTDDMNTEQKTGLDRISEIVDEVSNIDENKDENNDIESDDEISAIGSEGYKPNFSYEVGGESKEFDPDIQSIITDKNVEDKIRDLYEQAQGYSSEDVERKEMLEASFNALENLKDDVPQLAKVMGITDDQILDFATQILERRQMPVERQNEISELEKLKEENGRLKNDISDHEHDRTQQLKEKFEFDLNSALSDRKISNFQKKFDAITEDGHFRKLVFEYGQKNSIGKHTVPPKEAVEAVYSTYKRIVGEESLPTNNRDNPIIPQVRGKSNQSPVAKKMTSLDDLRKYANQL